MTPPDAGQRLIEDLRAKLTSGNSLPVERVTLKAQEANDLLEMIERLQFEREHYAESNRVGAEALKAAQPEIERLRGVESDARRYRWLREHECADDLYAMGFALKGGEWLDESIDAAIAASRSTGAADVGEEHG